jgi:hypothetical protein
MVSKKQREGERERGIEREREIISSEPLGCEIVWPTFREGKTP